MIPAATKMKGSAIANYGQQLGPDAMDYLDKLFGAVEKAWKSWQDGMRWGGLTVSGAGVGAFSGMGSGGMLQAGSSFQMEVFTFKDGSPQQKKFTKGLADALRSKFDPFPATYKITMMQYVGTSGATPVSPGPVQAQNTPATMMIAGSGQNPSGIADLWKAALTPPDFDLGDPACKSGKLVDAISKAIEMEFMLTWLTSAQLMNNTLMTAATPGGAVPGAPSGMDGTIM